MSTKPELSIPTQSVHPVSVDTPKTPADEAIEFFQSDSTKGASPIRVYELVLDQDGGPAKDNSVSNLVSHQSIYRTEGPLQYIRLPPAYTPYVLRVSIDAGTPASRNGAFFTNFPLDGGVFQRDRFVSRR